MIGDRRGMTLMELVIALLITGLMAMSGASAFGSIVDHRRDIVRATAQVERAAALRETLHSWLVAGTILVTQGGLPTTRGRGGAGASNLRTVTPGSGTSSVASVTAAVASGDELDFTTNAPNPANAPGARLRLFIDGDNATAESGLALEYQASAAAPLLRRELEPAIDSMVVEYLDTRTNRWYPASEATTITPRAMRLTLMAVHGDSLPRILALPMVIPMGQQPQGVGR